ncbi:zinc finger protein 79-like isoform X1 [Solea solea]|uniref:zinc finger protein 79-like isoform X1 n=1 Tax=Solea solea TaxID=90069 RepID=UPI00272BDFD6|nr:zinc finger protein 79-like isoform X1 [Solea solea]XP_058480571.1 zinc finger protein 79-like isoform X1 [Solea solea]
MFCWTDGSSENLRGLENTSKAEILRGIVAEKMSTAAKEILAVVERTVTGYEEEVAGLRLEIDRQKQQLRVLLQPRVKLERTALITDVSTRDVDLDKDEEQQTQQSVGGNSGGADFLWYDDGDDFGSDDEEQTVQLEINSPQKQQDLQDPDFQIESSSMKRKPGRPRINDSESNHLDLKLRLLHSAQVDRLSNAVLKKCPLLELQCPRGLQEADFLQLLRSTFPQLPPHKHVDVFVSDRSRRLFPLRTRTLTPEEILTAIRSTGAGKSALYLRLKRDELEGKEEAELHMLPGNKKEDMTATEQEAGSSLRADALAVSSPSQQSDWKAPKKTRRTEAPGGHSAAPSKLRCHVCGRSYKFRGGFFKHAWSHVDELLRECGVCGARLDSVDELKAHLRRQHEMHDCALCGKSYSSAGKLAGHVATHAEQNRFRCDACGKTFTHRAGLNNHRWVHVAEKPHGCGVCGKRFGLKTQLKYHSKTHGAPDAYRCGECGRTLSGVTAFRRHRATHLAEQRCVCEVCGKRFKHPDRLKAHLRVHAARERRYLCDVCCKTFLSNGALKGHLRTHSGERPYVCDVCGKRFVARSCLTRHTAVHSDAAPHACAECGRSFKTTSSLKTHAASHAGVKRFVCKVCGKGCARQDHLTVHMRTHNGERPYKCSLCDRAFTQSHCLKTHMRRHETDARAGHAGDDGGHGSQSLDAQS